jgi:hypothetical protein
MPGNCWSSILDLVTCRKNTVASTEQIGSLSTAVSSELTKQLPLRAEESEDDGRPERHAVFSSDTSTLDDQINRVAIVSPSSTRVPPRSVLGTLRNLNSHMVVRATLKVLRPTARGWWQFNDDEDNINWGNLYRTDPESDY